MTLMEQFAADLADGQAWFNLDSFGKVRELNGKKILCVFVGDKPGRVRLLTNEKGGDFGVSRAAGNLFVRACDVTGVRTGQKLTLDGRKFIVTEARLIQDQVWRLTLEAGNG